MTTTALSTSYLTKLCRHLIPRTFSAVVSCDMIKDGFPSYSKTRAVIVNTLEARFTHGGHWVALYYDKPTDKFHYYDPYGMDYKTNKKIAAFLRKTKKKIKCHKKQVQSLFSLFCGYHSVAFLTHLDRGVDTNGFFRLYAQPPREGKVGDDDSNLISNDDTTVAFIKAWLKDERR